MLINLTVYFQAKNSIKNESQTSQYTILNQLYSSMESQLNIVSDFVSKLASDESLLYFLNASDLSDYESSYSASRKAASLTSAINMCKPINSIISDIYLFSLNNNLVWNNNGIYDRTQYADYYYRSNYSAEIYDAVSPDDLSSDFLLTCSDSESRCTFIIYPLPTVYHPKGYLAIRIDDSFVNTLLKQISMPYQSRLYLLDADSSVLYQSEAASQSSLDINLSEITESPYAARDAWVYSLNSTTLPIRYLAVSPYTPDVSDLFYLRLTLIISILFCLIGGGLLILLFLKRHYSPIKKLVEEVKERSDSILQENSNEYQIVSDALKDIYEKHSSIQEVVKRQNKTLYSYYLASLLKGRLPLWSMDDETIDAMEKEFSLEQYIVLVFMIDFSADFLTSHREIVESAYTAFSETQFLDMLSEYLGSEYPITSAQVSDLTACVISVPSEKTDLWQNDLREALIPITEAFEKKWNCRNFYSCSHIHHNVSELAPRIKKPLI